MKLPSFQFYPGDWMKDPDLRRCSAAARGIWIDMICLMFECQERGVLATSGVPWTNEEIAASISGNPNDNLRCVEELLSKGVAHRNEQGAVYNKRMIRDQQTRIADAERQREARRKKPDEEPGERPELVTPLSQRSSSSSSSSPSTTKKEERDQRPAKSPDERAKHPAVVAIREIRGRFPHKDVWDLIIEKVGSHPNMPQLKKCWLEWRSRNYNPEDLGWIVDWYLNGIPERRNGNGPQRETASQRNVRNLSESLASLDGPEESSRPPDLKVAPRMLASRS